MALWGCGRARTKASNDIVYIVRNTRSRILMRAVSYTMARKQYHPIVVAAEKQLVPHQWLAEPQPKLPYESKQKKTSSFASSNVVIATLLNFSVTKPDGTVRMHVVAAFGSGTRQSLVGIACTHASRDPLSTGDVKLNTDKQFPEFRHATPRFTYVHVHSLHLLSMISTK